MRFQRFSATALAMALLPLQAMAADVQVVIDGKVVVFSDVPSHMWFATHVQVAAEAGIVSGYKDERGNYTGKFGPGKDITIAEALKIAVEGAGYDEDAYASKVQSGTNHWASAYVSVAKARGFPVIPDARLDRSATRAEVAAIFTSAFGVNMDNLTVGPRYDDVKQTTKYALSIEALSRDKIVAGDTDIEGQATGRFRPTMPIVRAEVAKMIVNARAAYGTPGEGQVPDEMTGNENVVKYSASGFSPQVLRVKMGDTVTFRNDLTTDMWIASNPHPSHTNLSGFDARAGLGNGETYNFTFNQLGTFGYHNHLNPSHAGSIVVESN